MKSIGFELNQMDSYVIIWILMESHKYLLNIKGVRGQKTCFGELFWGFYGFLAERSKLR